MAEARGQRTARQGLAAGLDATGSFSRPTVSGSTLAPGFLSDTACVPCWTAGLGLPRTKAELWQEVRKLAAALDSKGDHPSTSVAALSTSAH